MGGSMGSQGQKGGTAREREMLAFLASLCLHVGIHGDTRPGAGGKLLIARDALARSGGNPCYSPFFREIGLEHPPI